jgi:retron-type reverse transcriptase
MSDCLTATNGADNVRKLQRALYRTSKQDETKRFYSLYDKVWRADVLWEAWRQVKANKGAPGVDGMAIEWIINAGYEEEMIQTLQEALREHRYQFAPVRMVEIPKPKGGTRPLGIAIPTVHYICLPAVFGICHHHPSPSSAAWPAL